MNEFVLHPRLQADTFFVKDLKLSRLLLINDKQYPWFVLVPRVPSATEAHHLNKDDRYQLMIESDRLCTAIEKVFMPDKLNVAAIGNVVPQLHVHHIARFRDDVSWPAPVWGARPAVAYNNKEHNQVIDQLVSAIDEL